MAVEEQARRYERRPRGTNLRLLEFNELEKDYDDYAKAYYDNRGSRLDIDYLDVDFLTRCLNVVEN